ncbi:MAG: NAD(P)H-binding protein [Nitrospirota bacterium]
MTAPYVVVLGANGVFGRRTVQSLLRRRGLQVGAACRTKEQAVALARAFGGVIRPLWGDVRRIGDLRACLDGAQAVFHCAGPFDAQPLLPLSYALERGLDYADLGDDPAYLKSTERLIDAAAPRNRIVVPGASSLPSMTAMLVQTAHIQWGAVDRIGIRVFIGNRNPKGRGAITYLIKALRTPFQTMRDGRWVQERTWREQSRSASHFDPRVLPFGLVESPDDHFLPRWFGAAEVSFRVSLEFSWIHRVIAAIGALERVLPRSCDPLWINALFYGHPAIQAWGSHSGWLEVTTTHGPNPGARTVVQRLGAFDEGQRVPSFPMSMIGRILGGEVERPSQTVTRFDQLLSKDQFLAALSAEGIDYKAALV